MNTFGIIMSFQRIRFVLIGVRYLTNVMLNYCLLKICNDACHWINCKNYVNLIYGSTEINVNEERSSAFKKIKGRIQVDEYTLIHWKYKYHSLYCSSHRTNIYAHVVYYYCQKYRRCSSHYLFISIGAICRYELLVIYFFRWVIKLY